MKQRTAARWPTTPQVLLSRMKDNRDAEAWSNFAELYGAVLVYYCVRRGLQHADAEDVAQKVLLDVSRQLASFEYSKDRGRFRCWLATIANRSVWRFRRRKASQGEVSLEALAELEQPQDTTWVADFNEAVLDLALSRIRGEFHNDEWRAFELARNAERRAVEIASQFQRPVGWIYQVKYRILQRLKLEVSIVSRELEEPAG